MQTLHGHHHFYLLPTCLGLGFLWLRIFSHPIVTHQRTPWRPLTYSSSSAPNMAFPAPLPFPPCDEMLCYQLPLLLWDWEVCCVRGWHHRILGSNGRQVRLQPRHLQIEQSVSVRFLWELDMCLSPHPPEHTSLAWTWKLSSDGPG